jgi:hydrogenase nickel incorporation protein HypA/HybF
VHELSIALAIASACRAEIAARGGGRLAAVRGRVGDLAGVEPDLLRRAWTTVAAAEADGATLAIEREPAESTCPRCGPVPEATGTWLRPCPHCGEPLRVTGGDALDLVELAFDAPDPQSDPRLAATPAPA